ncbi:MAG: excinuclease ABC subunit UvrC [Alphaproteobacteria bacterium]
MTRATVPPASESPSKAPADDAKAPEVDAKTPEAGAKTPEAGAKTPEVDAKTPEAGDRPLGVEVIRTALITMPAGPGVYRMLDAKGDPLYVGKARSLKKRVASYAKLAGQHQRTARMISETATVEVVVTHTEAEALLLEANLIKSLKPHFNIVLRDDKSHPYILLTGDHDWAQLVKHRGARNRSGEYFGPFASAGAVNRTLNALQRAFPMRSCSDSVFANHSRPCLQYQIKRCTAPCVDKISKPDYAELVAQTREFLSGRSQAVQRQLSTRMDESSETLDFETAAVYRDRLRALAHVQAHQGINLRNIADADAIAGHQQAGQTCVQVFFIRGGRNYGNRAHYLSHPRETPLADVLSNFIAQFYDNREAPPMVLVNAEISSHELIEQALSIRADRKVRVIKPRRGDRKTLIDHAVTNARDALARRLAENASQRRLIDGVAALFGLESAPNRIEVYDNSHIQGSEPVGGMIVAGPEGMVKNAYRKFNIKTGKEANGGEALAPGDDYAMMRQVLTRRFARLLKEDPERSQGQWPDLVLIDGGPGQLSSVMSVLDDLGIGDQPIAAISKGPDRNAGRERFHVPGRAPFMLPPNDPVLYYLQRLRDEAHRFAIGTHRARRSKAIGRSELDGIAGIGAKRKRALLHQFGSARGVSEAALVDLERVDGVNKTVAQRIYDHFHG